MKWKSLTTGLVFLLAIGAAACNRAPKSPDVQDQIERSLHAAGLTDVTAKQDRDKGVVTLGGTVPSEDDKNRASQIAESQGAGQVVANEISVRPPGAESEAKDTQSALDKGIEDNFKAEVVSHKLDGVDYSAKEGVLTLSGTVHSQAERNQVEKLAKAVPNVKQVVNTLEVEGQKATTTR